MSLPNIKKFSNNLFLILKFIFKCVFSVVAAILFLLAKSSKKNRKKKQTEEQEDLEFFNHNKKWPML